MSNCFQGLGECARGVVECAGCRPLDGAASCMDGLTDFVGGTQSNEFWYFHDVYNGASLLEMDILMNIISKDENNNQQPNFYEDDANQAKPNCSKPSTFGTYSSGDAPYPPPAEGQDTSPGIYTR